MKNLLNKINESIEVSLKNPFYQNRLKPISSMSDFNKIMLLNKEELLKLEVESFLKGYLGDVYEYHETSGTEEKPLVTWFTKNDFMAYVNQINESPVEFNNQDRVLLRFPSALSVPAHTFTESVHQRGGCVIHAGRSDRNCGPARAVDLLIKSKAMIFAGNVMEAFILAYVAKQQGYDLKKDFSLRAICTAGEVLSEKRKKRLELLWGVPIYNFYGTTELGNLATSDGNSLLKASKQDFYFEVLDVETKLPVRRSQKGILYVTTLNKECFPLIRFNTGDIVSLEDNDAELYINHFGRSADSYIIGGRRFTLVEIQDSFLDLPSNMIGDFWKLKMHKEYIEIIAESKYYDKADFIKIHADFPYKITL